ncbi:Peroxisome size and maintenance regulator [Recurvomyces mirabilis]|nr:Peroxisome size and maintenance regulator [Recurvomyces mirabilis]
MDDPNTVANRDDAIPVLPIPSRNDAAPPSISGSESDTSKTRTRDKLKEQAMKLKDKLDHSLPPETKDRLGLQDRLFNGIMAQIIPPEELSENEGGNTAPDKDRGTAPGKPTQQKPDRRSRTYVDRPNFSIPQMSSNFRRFNSRIGPVFVLQNRLIHLLTWRQPTATLSLLAIHTLLCLNPHLLPLIPLVGLLFYILLPSFLARHPTPANDPRVEPGYGGAGIRGAEVSKSKPAPEMSKDFFRNMRDLQNSMEDFSRVHDGVNEFVVPWTDFSDEGTSSMIFVGCFGLGCLGVLGSEVVPWKFVMLGVGWVAVLAGQFRVQEWIGEERNLSQASTHAENLLAKLKSLIGDEIILRSPPSTRQVEIFELQKYDFYSETWEPWLFSPAPFDPVSPARIAGARAKGTQFFEDVAPPRGWKWKGKKWELDLESREWVEERMVQGVEVEMEGARWVVDLAEEVVQANLESPVGKKGSEVRKVKPRSGWEEGLGGENRGEWRRRRWVRLVERKVEDGVGLGGKG